MLAVGNKCLAEFSQTWNIYEGVLYWSYLVFWLLCYIWIKHQWDSRSCISTKQLANINTAENLVSPTP
jgi:hypothetical protein